MQILVNVCVCVLLTRWARASGSGWNASQRWVVFAVTRQKESMSNDI